MTGARTVGVTGAPLAGVSAVTRVLQARLPGYRVVEIAGLQALPPGERPAVVVFAVSAAAPMTASQAEPLDAAGPAVPIVAAVTKIDVHRGWRAVLAANRDALTRRAPEYADAVWVGVAADPDIGPEQTGELVEAVRAAARRSRRPRLRQARVALAGEIRVRCAALRVELQGVTAALPAGRSEAFADHVRYRAASVRADLDRVADGWLGVAAAPPSTAPPEQYPPLPRRPALENRLAALLGAGFGLGVTLAAGRLLADLAPRWVPAGILGSCAAGVALGWWVVRARRLLAERAALDRWVAEVTAALRTALQERVSERLLAAEALAAAGFRPDRRPR